MIEHEERFAVHHAYLLCVAQAAVPALPYPRLRKTKSFCVP